MTSSWKPLILTLAIAVTGALAVACTDGERSPGEGRNNPSAAGQAGRAGTGGAATAGAGDGGSAGGVAGGGAGGQSNVACEDLSFMACHTSSLNCCSFIGPRWVVNDSEQCIQSYTKQYLACAMYIGPSGGACLQQPPEACYRRHNGPTTEWIQNASTFFEGVLDPSWELVGVGACGPFLHADEMPPCAAGSGD